MLNDVRKPLFTVILVFLALLVPACGDEESGEVSTEQAIPSTPVNTGAIAGVWYGTAANEETGQRLEQLIEVDDSCELAAECGTYALPKLGCELTLELTGVVGQTHEFEQKELLRGDPSICRPGIAVSMEAQSRETLTVLAVSTILPGDDTSSEGILLPVDSAARRYQPVCPWNAMALFGKWTGVGGTINFFSNGDFVFSMKESGMLVDTESGHWECLENEVNEVHLFSRTSGASGMFGRVYPELNNDMLIVDRVNPRAEDHDFFRENTTIMERTDVDCSWDESLILGFWEGDRTVLPSGEPLGGSMEFTAEHGFECTLSDGTSYSGRWICADSSVNEIILTTQQGWLVKREITFADAGHLVLERIEKPGFTRDYYLVEN